ncbi:MAG: hypothetical protein ACOY81_02620 [Bacillota bacterium]
MKLAGIIILLIMFFLHRFCFAYLITGDAYYHLLVASEWRKMGKRPGFLNWISPKEEYLYPPFYHWLLKSGVRSTYICFAAELLVVFLFLAQNHNRVNLINILFSLIILVFSPIVLNQTYAATPRPLGYLFAVLTVISLVNSFNNWYWIIITSLLFTLMVLTHKLASQTMIFVIVIICIYYKWYYLFILIPLIWLLGYIILGKHFLSIIRDHVNFVKVHIKYGDLYSGQKELFPIFKMIKSQPYLLLLPFLPYHNVWFVWLISTLILSLFWPWGDGYRYIYYATWPLAWLILSVDLSNPVALGLLIAAFLINIGFIFYDIKHKKLKIKNDTSWKQALLLLTSGWPNDYLVMTLPRNEYLVAWTLGGGRAFGVAPNAMGIKREFEMFKPNQNSMASLKKLVQNFNYKLLIIATKTNYRISLKKQ